IQNREPSLFFTSNAAPRRRINSAHPRPRPPPASLRCNSTFGAFYSEIRICPFVYEANLHDRLRREKFVRTLEELFGIKLRAFFDLGESFANTRRSRTCARNTAEINFHLRYDLTILEG